MAWAENDEPTTRTRLPIVVPCHRVIGADGTLVGFGGGKEVQAWLVDLERGQGRLGGGSGIAP